MSLPITIRRLTGVWTVRAGGAVLGETEEALELHEIGYPPVIYFPRKDIAMAMLDRSEKTTHCPRKGTAHYYSIVTRSATLTDTVWTYEDPLTGVADIKDHLAFLTGETITVEEI